MSMLDAFFNKGFKGAKCKTLLKLTIPRIKLLRNRREIQLKQMRKDIAKLLENGQEATARIRVEHIIREENMMAAQEIIELFCELIAVRLPIIETQRECPLDLKEAISSICFAAPRCSDLPELQQVQMLFAMKYGKEFVLAATELMPDCGVNRQIIELLSVRAPSIESKLKLLKEIAEEHELDWDPAASETEFLKPHDDLLNGPNHNHIIGGPMPPLPKEKHDESLSSKPVEESHEESDSDEESLDLPEVPTVSVRATSDTPSASHILPPPPPPHYLEHDIDRTKLTTTDEPEVYVAHILPPPPPPHYLEHDIDRTKLTTTDEPEVYVADPSLPTMENKQFQFIPFVSSPPSPPVTLPPKPSNPTPSPARTRTETNVDLQDVLAAAQAAAETAERAAAAARAAASLAQVRISELVTNRNVGITDDGEKNVPHDEAPHPPDVRGSPIFDKQNSFDGLNRMSSYDLAAGLGSPTLSAHGVPRMGAGSPDSKEQAHQPRRSTSLEDDPYFSYPNLFTASQDTSIKPGTPPS